jgi:hypothetical protein
MIAGLTHSHPESSDRGEDDGRQEIEGERVVTYNRAETCAKHAHRLCFGAAGPTYPWGGFQTRRLLLILAISLNGLA